MRAIQAAQTSPRKRATLVRALLVLTVAAFLLAGCAVRLIGNYDDVIDAGITDVQQKAELYFAKLQSTPSTPYDQGFYDDVDSHLAVLKSRAAALPKNQIVVTEIGNLKAQFDDFEKLDRISPRPFPAGAVNAARSGIETSVESILKLEFALKRSGKSPPEL
jgi:hypothetical protein